MYLLFTFLLSLLCIRHFCDVLFVFFFPSLFFCPDNCCSCGCLLHQHWFVAEADEISDTELADGLQQKLSTGEQEARDADPLHRSVVRCGWRWTEGYHISQTLESWERTNAACFVDFTSSIKYPEPRSRTHKFSIVAMLILCFNVPCFSPWKTVSNHINGLTVLLKNGQAWLLTQEVKEAGEAWKGFRTFHDLAHACQKMPLDIKF